MDSSLDRSQRIITVAAFAAFLATFNETFLNVAFSPIMADLKIGVATVQWLATAYMLGAAVMVPVSAFLYKSFPTKRLFLFTVGLLIMGSVIGALAENFPILLVGRIVQSLGTGMLIPVGMNITLEVAPKEKLGTYMGIMGAMTTLGPSLSVIVSGVLLSFFNWHMLLWVFAILSTVCFILGVGMLGNIAKLTHPRLDAASVALVGIALVGILYGISTVFSGNILIALVAAVVGAFCLVIFVARQKKLNEPLIDLRPLSVKPFAIGVIINMISLVVIFAMNIVMPIFMQNALNASAFNASLTLFPAILLSCVVSPIAGKLYDRHGEKIILPLGFILICIFTAALSFCTVTKSLVLIAILYIPVICGSALIIGPIQSFALSRLEPQLNPHGVTVMSTGFQIAGCIGASIFTGVYSVVVSMRTAAGVPVYNADGSGFMAVGILAAAFALAGLILALYIKKYGDKVSNVNRSATLCSIMKAEAYTVSTDATLFDAMKIITDKKISGVPVVGSNKNIVGFISDGDIMRYLAKCHPLFVNAYSLATINDGEQGFDEKLRDLLNLKVTDVAVKNVITVNANDDLSEVCRILSEHNLKKAPVMESGHMIGIINRSNITKYAMNACLTAISTAE